MKLSQEMTAEAVALLIEMRRDFTELLFISIKDRAPTEDDFTRIFKAGLRDPKTTLSRVQRIVDAAEASL